MKEIMLVVVLALIPLCTQAQQGPSTSIPLWSHGAPGAVGKLDEDRPSLTIFLPPAGNAIGTGVVVCPGGGYWVLAMNHEGYQVARWLNSIGVAAFVLKYRLAPRYALPSIMEDGERAVRCVRFHGGDFGVSPGRVGIMGFSAGGHLASYVATHFDSGNPRASDPIDRVSDRPNCLILAYGNVTIEPGYASERSREALLGSQPDPELMSDLSNELHVTSETPPTFLYSTTQDKSTSPEAILFYQALIKAGVPAELHIYEKGAHGVGLAQDNPILSTWPTLLANWLKGRGLLTQIYVPTDVRAR